MNALSNGCGIVRWENSTIVRHTGPDALDLLHRLTTKDLLGVGVGHSRRTALTTDKGRVVDVFLVAHSRENELLLVSDSIDPARTVSAIDYYTIIEDAELSDLSTSHSRLSLIGPRATLVAAAGFGVTVDTDKVVGASHKSAGVTLISDSSRGVEWVDVICEAGTEDSVLESFEQTNAVAVDTAHFELFRIENAIPGSDREYGAHSNPIEAGLLDLIDWDKGCYVGQEVIARLDAYDKVQRNLKVLVSANPLEEGASLASDSKPAGVVTSASALETKSGDYLSLGLVRKAFLEAGTELDADGTSVRVR